VPGGHDDDIGVREPAIDAADHDRGGIVGVRAVAEPAAVVPAPAVENVVLALNRTGVGRSGGDSGDVNVALRVSGLEGG
jgi:hypothetical protein